MDRPNNGERPNYKSINLVLSEFYDGAQLYTSKVFDTTSEASDINL